MKSKMCWHALAHAFVLEAYIALVMFAMPRLGSILPSDDASMIGGLVFVSIFVFSAAVAATLVFGRPVMMFLSGDKKGAVAFLASTLGWLFALIVLTLLGYFVFMR